MEEAKEVARLALDIGCGIIECGGEVSRAEDSAVRVALAFGMKRCDVFALNSFFLLTVENGSGVSVTLSKRVKTGNTDFSRLEELNSASRAVCEGRLSREKAEKVALNTDKSGMSTLLNYLVSMAVCAVFSLYFGGGYKEAVASAIAASVTVFMKNKAKAIFGNAVVFTFVCSFLSGFCGALFVVIGFAGSYDLIAQGDIMLLIPGLSLISAARDAINGDMLTGLLRFIETILIALALTAGFVLPKFLLLS